VKADLQIAGRLERLEQSLRQRLRQTIDITPPLMHAGVLIPLLLLEEDVQLLFTRRTETVLTHKGQISFPGGQREAADVDVTQTALRESYEEIGLEPSRVRVIGELDDVFTSVSGFVITPVVGLVAGGMEYLHPAPDEVKSLFTVPVATLLQEKVHSSETRHFENQGYRIHYYTVGEDVIWGATGRIVYQFLQAWRDAA
jgi:8-oxo-dGTP pyrophosphatase MutT (NUDIX family)